MSLRKKPRLSEEEQALQDQRNREIREARLALYNLAPPQPPPPIGMSSKASSRRTSPAQSPQASSSSSNMIEEDDKCSICLDRLTETNIYTTTCGHTFHKGCYNQLQTQQCPMCRASLDEDVLRPADRSSFEQLVTPDSDYPSDDETEMERVLRYISTIRDNRLRSLAAQIFHMRNNVSEQQLRFMILAATGNPTHTAPDLLESLYSDSDFGSVSSRSSPVGSVSSRNSRRSVSSRNSRGSVSSRNSPVGSVYSRSSRGSTAASELPYYFSSDDDDNLYLPHPISSSMASNASSSSSSIRPPPMSSSSNSNRVTARKKTNRVVRNPSPPVSINVGDDDEWIKSLYNIQNRGEKRKRGGKSKRKNNKKNSRKTSRSR